MAADEEAKMVQDAAEGKDQRSNTVRRRSLSMGDIKGALIEYALEGVPTLLKEHLTCEYDTWEDFLEVVRTVPKEKLSIG
ncbi:hypothetical protein PAXRUDRAFT_22257 [Paxillus rubicundulus Ve08.2h10]|uniref:Uncharacterized protein n=1 Tax=Paxillus rubicundulus Ve08.2h10 TaxID=930991 RepID=A0A0D0C974_9AGAM|nr:hypothetical protein PAXRUDRAFT_22257 [Paxillus rubicundulus Ve08.2h10]